MLIALLQVFGLFQCTDELGDLDLSDDDEDALVKFMKTLSDGYQP